MGLYDIPTLAKQPSESRLYFFTFTSKMADTETIATISSCTAAPSGLTVGATAISGQRVQVRLSGGTDGAVYKLTCIVVTSLGNTLEVEAQLFVVDT